MTRNEQIEALQFALRQKKDKRLFERYQTVYLHMTGKSNRETAVIIQRNGSTVGEYLKAYRNEG